MMAIAVDPNDTEDWKEPLSWHFDEFCKDGSIWPVDLWTDVESGLRQLWVLYDDGVKVAILTRTFSARIKICEVTHAVGEDRHMWQHLWQALEHWARGVGCKRIKATARPGWERILPLKKTHVVLEREL